MRLSHARWPVKIRARPQAKSPNRERAWYAPPRPASPRSPGIAFHSGETGGFHPAYVERFSRAFPDSTPQRASAASSALRASTQRSPAGVFSFFQNGACVFR